MFILKHQGTSFYLRDNTTYTFGRKDCDIILTDNTVSKKHAQISVKDNLVFVEDLKSSNKTFVNGSDINTNKKVPMDVGCEIRFGKCPSTYILHKELLIVTSSGLNRNKRMQLKNVVDKMKGTVINEWSEKCTYIVVDELILTMKVLCAFIRKQHIVTADYFNHCWKAIEEKTILPDTHNFKPNVTEEILQKGNETAYRMDRRALFKNKVFVFPNNIVMKKMENMIVLAGGKPISFESNPINVNELLPSKLDYLFISVDNASQTQAEFTECIQFLKRHNIREIPVQEIAMAVYVGNCDLNCNAKYNKVAHVFSATKRGVDKQVLVPETQTESEQSVMDHSLEIPATAETELKNGNKRAGMELQNKNKKIKIGPEIPVSKSNNTEVSNIGDIPAPIFTSTQNSDNNNLQKKLNSFGQRQKVDVTAPSTSKCINPFATTKKRKAPELNYTGDNPFINSKSFLSSTRNDMPAVSATRKRPEEEPILKECIKKTKLSENDNSSNISSNIMKQPASTQEKSTNRKRPEEEPILNNKKTKLSENENSFNISSNIMKHPDSTKEIYNNNNNSNHTVACNSMASLSTLKQTKLSSTISTKIKWYTKSSTDDVQNTTDVSMSDLIQTFVTNVVLVSDDSLRVNKTMKNTTCNSTDLNSTMRNFKRFKKVQPVHIQTTIIPRSSYQKLVCGLNGVISDDEDDGREVSIAVSEKKETIPKKKKQKFQFNALN